MMKTYQAQDQALVWWGQEEMIEYQRHEVDLLDLQSLNATYQSTLACH